VAPERFLILTGLGRFNHEVCPTLYFTGSLPKQSLQGDLIFRKRLVGFSGDWLRIGHSLVLCSIQVLPILIRGLLGKAETKSHARAFCLNSSSCWGLSVLLCLLHSLHFLWKQIFLAFLHICARAIAPIILTRHWNHEWLFRIANSLAISSDLATGKRIEARDFFVCGCTLFVGGIIVMVELMRATGQGATLVG
jgi:hypothetical protein